MAELEQEILPAIDTLSPEILWESALVPFHSFKTMDTQSNINKSNLAFWHCAGVEPLEPLKLMGVNPFNPADPTNTSDTVCLDCLMKNYSKNKTINNSSSGGYLTNSSEIGYLAYPSKNNDNKSFLETSIKKTPSWTNLVLNPPQVVTSIDAAGPIMSQQLNSTYSFNTPFELYEEEFSNAYSYAMEKGLNSKQAVLVGRAIARAKNAKVSYAKMRMGSPVSIDDCIKLVRCEWLIIGLDGALTFDEMRLWAQVNPEMAERIKFDPHALKIEFPEGDCEKIKIRCLGRSRSPVPMVEEEA